MHACVLRSSNFPLRLPNCHSGVGLPLIVSGTEPNYIDSGKAAGGSGDTCRKIMRLTERALASTHKAVVCFVSRSFSSLLLSVIECTEKH